MSASAQYRIKERQNTYTPQKRLLGMWWSIARPQPTMEAASAIIRKKLKPPAPRAPS